MKLNLSNRSPNEANRSSNQAHTSETASANGNPSNRPLYRGKVPRASYLIKSALVFLTLPLA